VIQPRQLLALLALTIMWGVNWPMMKFSLRELPPLHFRALTMTAGSCFLYAWYRARGLRMLPRRDEWPAVLAIGAPNMLGWHTASILGVRELASGRAAILGFTMPIWTVLIGVAFLGEKLTRRVALAAACVAITIVLLTSGEFTRLSGRPLGVAWMEFAAICWAIGTILIRRTVIALPVETLTIWTMLLSSVFLWIFALAFEPAPSWHFSGPMWVSLFYGAFINYGFAQTVWAGLARHLPPATSAMSLMAVPLVGTLSATFIVGEWPHWQDYLAIVFVTIAMAAVLLPPRTRPKLP
jgi:drug/metabolite transporter (DMT)-like permease